MRVLLLLLLLSLDACADGLYALRFTTGPAWDASKPAQEQKFFAEHSAGLARLRREGVVALGGRFADTGLIVVRAASAEEARALVAGDPSVGAGVFKVAVDEMWLFYPWSPPASAELACVRSSVEAFNKHDAAALTALYAADLKWWSVSDKGLSLEVDGAAAARDWLAGYFKEYPDVRSEILELSQSGPFVSFREQVTWKGGSQTSHAVYEVRDGRIVRVWYYPPSP